MSKLDNVIRGGVIENMLISPKQTRFVISLNDEPVSYQSFTSLDPSIRATTGQYCVKYIPESIRDGDKRAYLVGHDLYAFKTKVYNKKHFLQLAKKLPELAWLQRNTNFSLDLFDIAVQHPGMAVPFGLNVVSYCNMIRQKAEKAGIDINNKPLVAFRCSNKDYHEKYEPMNKFCYVPNKSDYAKELAEVEENVLKQGD